MCGIAGYVRCQRNDRARTAVSSMLAAMARRGPDSEGMAEWPGVVLGHRRLAILDLSPAGHQPMLSEDGRVGLVFNGCIYNFAEIRTELEHLHHRFRSQCDTEVLLRGYLEWGIDPLVSRLRGMFAFAIWDDGKQTLTLVRDRLGVKPLIYCERGGEIAFASTVTGLRAAGLGGEIDPQAVLEYLEFGYVTEERAIFQGLSKLPPATILEWRDGEIRQRQYWTLPEADEASGITFEQAVEETERLLVEAVRLRLVSDVPVGALLSGGIDSSLVCWAMAKLNANIRTFTVSAPDDPSDESTAAAQTAALLGIPHEIVQMPDTDFSLDELTNAHSEPFSCSSAQAMLWVSRAVKRNATVLLTGDGGDDVYLGYSFMHTAWKAQQVARRLAPGSDRIWHLTRGLLPGSGFSGRLRHFLDYATGGLGDYIRAHNGLPYYENRGLLGDRLSELRLPLRQIPSSAARARHLLADALNYHREVHFTSEFMPKVDGATMYYGLEARAPFLDQKIWEFAATLPPDIRFQGNTLKAVLREIARRRVSPAVASRKKQGFTVPTEQWLADRWSGMLDRLCGETLLEQEGWIRPGALGAPVREALSRRRVPVQIWHLLVLDHWLEKNRVRAENKAAMLVPQPVG